MKDSEDHLSSELETTNENAAQFSDSEDEEDKAKSSAEDIDRIEAQLDENESKPASEEAGTNDKFKVQNTLPKQAWIFQTFALFQDLSMKNLYKELNPNYQPNINNLRLSKYNMSI